MTWCTLNLGLDACKEKQNAVLDTYFYTLICLRNVIWCKRPELLSQKVVLIYDHACPHKALLIQALLKDFHWEQFEHPLYSLNLAPSDYLFTYPA